MRSLMCGMGSLIRSFGPPIDASWWQMVASLLYAAGIVWLSAWAVRETVVRVLGHEERAK